MCYRFLSSLPFPSSTSPPPKPNRRFLSTHAIFYASTSRTITGIGNCSRHSLLFFFGKGPRNSNLSGRLLLSPFQMDPGARAL